MKLSLKKILFEKGYFGHFSTIEGPGDDFDFASKPTEFPEELGGPCEVKVGKNHGHKMKVSYRDIVDKQEKTYHIRGSSEHDHLVELNKEDFEKLEEEGKLITISSEDEGHKHKILIKCTRPQEDSDIE